MTNEQLVAFIQAGNTELTPILWDKVKHLCYMICGRYYSTNAERFVACGVELSDLRQESYLAFLRAIDSFKPNDGVLFTSYLNFPIKNCAANLLGTRNSERKNHRPLDNCESLDTSIESPDFDNYTLGDILPDERSTEPFEVILDGIADEDTRRVLTDALGQLSEIQRSIIVMYYFEDISLKAISKKIGFSGERVRQIRNKALRLLRCMPEVVMLRQEQKIERRFHRFTNTNSPEYFMAQRKISDILARGDYLSYGQRQAILCDCAVRLATENSPEYQLFCSLYDNNEQNKSNDDLSSF